MIFFTYFLNAPVRDSQGQTIGKATDALIRLEQSQDASPLISMIVSSGRNRFCIVVESIESWGPGAVVLDRKMADAQVRCPEGDDVVSLRKTVLDKQIVDLAGMRVVRVNDLQFARVRGAMSLIAIDVSTRGLLRRIGVRSPALDRIFKPNFIEWKQVRLIENRLHLSESVSAMVKLHPADIANIIEKMNVRQGSIFLESLDQATAARVLEEIQPDIKKVLVKSLGPKRAAEIMGKMSVDELVDLIQLLPTSESREVIQRLPADAKIQKMKNILEYDEDTAGGLMTTEYIVARPLDTVERVIGEMKAVSEQHHSIQYVYVADADGKLQGVVSTRRLLISPRDAIVRSIMKSAHRLPTASEHDNLKRVATLMTRYNLFSIAVLDSGKRLIGVVTADDIMRRLIPNA